MGNGCLELKNKIFTYLVSVVDLFKQQMSEPEPVSPEVSRRTLTPVSPPTDHALGPPAAAVDPHK